MRQGKRKPAINRKRLKEAIKRLETRIRKDRALRVREVGAKERFSRLIRKIARSFWRDSINRGEFWEAMANAVSAGFDKAWEWGARAVGIQPGELTVDELQALTTLKTEQYARISDLAQTIYEKKRDGESLKSWFWKLKAWDMSYVKVQNQAKLSARANPKLKWVWNPAKEHCGDCTGLNGRVYRKSTWEKHDIYPQSRDLECGPGGMCGCKFEVTDEPCTPGRPPKIAGQKK